MKNRAEAPAEKRQKAQDTIICPAREEGFKETFIGQNCWYAIRLNPKRIPFLKYIAAYRIRPISAITHYARVDRIEPYNQTGKYIVYFTAKARNIGPIPLKDGKGPQGPMFSNWEKLKAAKSLADIK